MAELMNYFGTIITNEKVLAQYNAAADAMGLSPARTEQLKSENAARLAWWKSRPAAKRAAFLGFFGEAS